MEQRKQGEPVAGVRGFTISYIAWLGKASLLKGHLNRDLNDVRMASHVDMQMSIYSEETVGENKIAVLGEQLGGQNGCS